ncbi:sigma-E processing peptidase SpoIIGA [Clostridium senegalense]|uniref:sigma-E processing peptidase SpoIIGA n=1 Tax=Clostridium senegalense TaxID=1465809 RepID=UPI001C10D57D|nr:sigma-E processing peptidase SpoIIGA [Clostridium senegalense]MBU5225638.1 sigma-E processing peptidase SpoIIGA [Clostridium senegalense]
MVLYLDELILENFLVNLFLLQITFRTIKKRCTLKRQILAAFLGSLYVIVIIFPALRFLNNKITSVLVAFLMILICTNNKKFYLKGTLIYIGYSMVLAGTTFYFSIGNKGINNYIFKFNYKKLALSVMAIYLIIDRLVFYIKDRKLMHQYIYDVDVLIKEKNIKFKGFLDTGNELREPITNLPVIVVQKNILEGVDIKDYIKYSITYSVVNGNLGKLQGFKPDSVIINENGQKITKEVILAYCDNQLSYSKDYGALLPRGILV